MTASAALPAVAFAALVLAALVLTAVALAVILRATARLDVRRSVRVHASPRQVWDRIASLPDLHGRHGKTREHGRLEAWSLRQGDGTAGGSVWRATGTLDGSPYWTEVEVVRAEPPRLLEIALRADALGTERGIRAHRGVLTLEPADTGGTKITWTLQARLRGMRLRTLRLVACARLRALLLDLGLRSIKGRIETAAEEAAQRSGAAEEAGVAAAAGESPAGLTAPRRRAGMSPGSNRPESSPAP
jgi:uncharacterized protein YndB with AHSA1/START domain